MRTPANFGVRPAGGARKPFVAPLVQEHAPLTELTLLSTFNLACGGDQRLNKDCKIERAQAMRHLPLP